MKGDPDKKYMTHQTMYFSDGTEITANYRPNPNAEEIIAKVSEARAEIQEVTASETVSETEETNKTVEV